MSNSIKVRNQSNVQMSPCWKVFSDPNSKLPILPNEILTQIPEFIEINSRKIYSQKVDVPSGDIDLSDVIGGTEVGKTAYIFAELEVKEDMTAWEIVLGFGADWWFQTWLDGELIADTTASGNPFMSVSKYDVIASPSLSAGKHILAVRFISGSATSNFSMGILGALNGVDIWHEDKEAGEMGFKPYQMRIGNADGGWQYKDAQIQFLVGRHKSNILPYSMAKMDNGEIILLATWELNWFGRSQSTYNPVCVKSFSKDNGVTWTDWELIPNAWYSPTLLAYMGKGNLMFTTNARWFSNDYGRSWTSEPLPKIEEDGMVFAAETANSLVEIDSLGNVVIAEGAYVYDPVNSWSPEGDHVVKSGLRWSYDRGLNWTKFSYPNEWFWQDDSDGNIKTRGNSEVALIRADNGCLISGIRMDPTKLLAKRACIEFADNFCGLGFSLSKDNGKTWSDIQRLFYGGRMHTHFVKMKNGDIAMIYAIRQDIGKDGKSYDSYKRGAGALISKDNGQSWDISREYRIHEFDYADNSAGMQSYPGGHIASTLLDDGSILTAYGHKPSMGVALIKWKP